jgi:hypothetical protein
MLILGLDEVEYEPFYFIKAIDDIGVTPPNSTVVFEYSKDNLKLIKHCRKNNISFALICNTLKDTLLANTNDADFIICDKTIVKDAQKFADEYMFDAKVLLYSGNEDELLWCANESIDGIIFENAIAYEAVK